VPQCRLACCRARGQDAAQLNDGNCLYRNHRRELARRPGQPRSHHGRASADHPALVAGPALAFHCVTSEEVVREASQGDPEMSRLRLEALADMPVERAWPHAPGGLHAHRT
jgi:hypothetical protein